MNPQETNILARLKARADGVIKDRSHGERAGDITPPIPPVVPNPNLVITPKEERKKPSAKVETREVQPELFHRSKRANDGFVTRFTDDEIVDKRKDIATTVEALNMNISMSDHNRICHHYFKRSGARITKDMILEVWASDRRRQKRQNDIMTE